MLQRQLAARLRVSLNTVRNWEKDRRPLQNERSQNQVVDADYWQNWNWPRSLVVRASVAAIVANEVAVCGLGVVAVVSDVPELRVR